MTTFHQQHDTYAINRLMTLFDELPAGCDPDFDTGTKELERQFAELRINLRDN